VNKEKKKNGKNKKKKGGVSNPAMERKEEVGGNGELGSTDMRGNTSASTCSKS